MLVCPTAAPIDDLARFVPGIVAGFAAGSLVGIWWMASGLRAARRAEIAALAEIFGSKNPKDNRAAYANAFARAAERTIEMMVAATEARAKAHMQAMYRSGAYRL